MINVNCCRDYADANNERQKSVEEFYKTQHTNQSLDFVRSLLYYNYSLRVISFLFCGINVCTLHIKVICELLIITLCLILKVQFISCTQKKKNTVIMFSFAGKENEARVWKTGQDGDEHLGML